ncbi:MAG: HNH endonuclease [Sphingomonas sp.]|jgi:hypothetical protein|uniref:HNH endonuclease n=1 Tax=Sphingomonas sp. TaxID=28214 RepID=UPI003563354D
MGTTPDEVHIDHINGNGLDNRRSNLRGATQRQNLQNAGRRVDNTSGFKGVYYSQASKKWAAQIRYEGKQKYLGLFHDARDAAKAYNAAALKYFGAFARLNEGV